MSQEIQESVYKQQEKIKDKQLSVKEDLDQVEPAVIESQNGTTTSPLSLVTFPLPHASEQCHLLWFSFDVQILVWQRSNN